MIGDGIKSKALVAAGSSNVRRHIQTSAAVYVCPYEVPAREVVTMVTHSVG